MVWITISEDNVGVQNKLDYGMRNGGRQDCMWEAAARLDSGRVSNQVGTGVGGQMEQEEH